MFQIAASNHKSISPQPISYLPSSAQYTATKPTSSPLSSPVTPPTQIVPSTIPVGPGADQLISQQTNKGGRRVGEKENLYSRKKVKSPDLMETTFTMSTIEEEMEGVNIGHTQQPYQ